MKVLYLILGILILDVAYGIYGVLKEIRDMMHQMLDGSKPADQGTAEPQPESPSEGLSAELAEICSKPKVQE